LPHQETSMPSKFSKEFKEFISRGSVIDLAVGI
jgi:large-conductance mechanosensitive channel